MLSSASLLILHWQAVGCVRMRVGFDFSNFSLESCVREQLQTSFPGNLYKNLGSRTAYTNFTGRGGQVWAGPPDSGPGGWTKIIMMGKG